MEPSRPLTAEEEAVKKNTDCIYFLAPPPMTCKKGIECEFRHSEGARNNPRDCYYWLNGNCANPKCSFRHQPLDGLFEAPPAPPRLAPPAFQAAAEKHISAAQIPVAYNANKQGVPCHFFQMGQCLKGDRCPFMHGPHPSSNQVAQQPPSGPSAIINHTTLPVPKLSASYTGTSQTVQWGMKECTTTQPNVSKPVQVPTAKSSSKVEHMPNNGQPLPVIAPVSSDSNLSRPRYSLQNGREAGEFMRESSPGFDVLVHDNTGDSEYYEDEEPKRTSVRDGRISSRSAQNPDHNRPDFERNARGYSHHERDHERKRRSHRELSPHDTNGSDLRQLLKQRRLNGGDREHRRRDDRYDRSDDRYERNSNRDRSVSSRLQGRIRLPPRTSPDRPIESRLDRDRPIESRLDRDRPIESRLDRDRPIESRLDRDRDRDLGRNRVRLSPVRPQVGIRSRISEDLTRNNRDPLDFAAPKSLAELKGLKSAGAQESEAPKSLSNILKKSSPSNADEEEEEGLILAEDDADNVDVVQDEDLENAEDADFENVEDQEGEENYEDDQNVYEEAEEGENVEEDIAYEEEEEVDDDDDDEFAKKIGVFFS